MKLLPPLGSRTDRKIIAAIVGAIIAGLAGFGLLSGDQKTALDECQESLGAAFQIVEEQEAAIAEFEGLDGAAIISEE